MVRTLWKRGLSPGRCQVKNANNTDAKVVRRSTRGTVLIGLGLSASLLVGCANAGEGAFSGAAVGALTGLTIGSIFGEAGTGAAVGALGGAAIGGVIGDQNQRADHRAQGYYGNSGYSHRGYSRTYTRDGYPCDW